MSECSISEQFEETELEIYIKCESILVHHNTTSDWLIKGDVTEHVFSKKNEKRGISGQRLQVRMASP